MATSSTTDSEMISSSVGSGSSPIRLRVCTYNILAKSYCRDTYFPYADKKAVRWAFRKDLLSQQFAKIGSDCYLLQEVDEPDDICSALQSLGYDSVYCRRTGGKRDGCVLSWNADRLELISDVYLVDLNLSDFARSQVTRERFKRSNIGVIAVLRCLDDDGSGLTRLILLCTAHLFWDPSFADVKVYQAAVMLANVQFVRDSIQSEFNTRGEPFRIHIIFGGDLNSMPHSDVYQYITKGRIIEGPSSSSPSSSSSSDSSGVPPMPRFIHSVDQLQEFQKSLFDVHSSSPIYDGIHGTLSSEVRLIIDKTLRRVAVWLAYMGCDVVYLTDALDDANCKPLFERAMRENRVIVSRNKRVLSFRHRCRYMIIGPRTTQSHAFVQVMRALAVALPFARLEVGSEEMKKQDALDVTLMSSKLPCPQCLGLLSQKPLELVRDKLPVRTMDCLREKGESLEGEPVNFYECGDCESIVYHKGGWPERIVDRRKVYYWNAVKGIAIKHHVPDLEDDDYLEYETVEDVAVMTSQFERMVGPSPEWSGIGRDQSGTKKKRLEEEGGDEDGAIGSASSSMATMTSMEELKTALSERSPLLDSFVSIALILPDCVFHKKNPLIFGIEMLRGALSVNDHVFAIPLRSIDDIQSCVDLGKIGSIQQDKKQVKKLNKSKERGRGALKIASVKQYGRHFEADTHILVTLKRKEREQMSAWNNRDIVELKKQSFITIPRILSASKITEFSHGLELVSLLKEACGKEPEFTNYTATFQGCLDYIFVDPANTRVVSASGFPVTASTTKTAADSAADPPSGETDATVTAEDDEAKSSDHKSSEDPSGLSCSSDTLVLTEFVPSLEHPSDHLPVHGTIELL